MTLENETIRQAFANRVVMVTGAGGSIGSNFGSVPYNNAATSKLSEFRFSPQNSRIGFRIESTWCPTSRS